MRHQSQPNIEACSQFLVEQKRCWAHPKAISAHCLLTQDIHTWGSESQSWPCPLCGAVGLEQAAEPSCITAPSSSSGNNYSGSSTAAPEGSSMSMGSTWHPETITTMGHEGTWDRIKGSGLGSQGTQDQGGVFST